MWSTEGKKRKKREIIQDNCYNDVSLHCMPVCHAMAYQHHGYEVKGLCQLLYSCEHQHVSISDTPCY